MKNIDRLTWLVLYVLLISILYAIYTLPNQTVDSFATTDTESIPYTEHYSMSGTAYTSHPDCVNPEWNDGKTSTVWLGRV